MQSLPIVVVAVVVFVIAYLSYGRWLVKTWGIDEKAVTPAHKFEDGEDFEPASRFTVFSHQFSSITGAGPVTGPIIAAMFGWAPALAWLIVGGIFFGAVQDLATLYASVKNEGKSVGMLIDRYVGKTGRILFLIFCWLFTLLLLAAFADILAHTFDGITNIGDATNLPSAQAATISMLYIFVAMGFGYFIRKAKPSEMLKFGVAIVLVIAMFIIGFKFPLYLDTQTWLYVIFAYCFIASIFPMWLLMEPRDYLSAFLLLGMVFSGVVGILVVNPELHMPAFVGFEVNGKSLFPFLFVMIACGAVSGFHTLVSAGTSSKTVDNEKDMLSIGYGAMLIESLLGVVALICACAAASNGSLPQGTPFQIFAGSISGFLQIFGLPVEISACVVTMCVSALAMTTVDSVARIGRMSFQELFAPGEGESAGSATKFLMNKYVATIITLFMAYILCLAGYMKIWPLFGAANQLLASLVLISLTVFLRTTGRKGWMLYIPMTFMFVATMMALIISSYDLAIKIGTEDFVFMIDGFQLIVAVALMILAVLIIRQCSKELVLQAIIVGSVVTIFIVGTVLGYYNIIHDEMHKNIIAEGKIAAWQSADRFDEYISANIDSVLLAAYTLDEMIRDKNSDAEIQDFLVKQSTAIKHVFTENQTGLYGYINGKFFSGVNWTPPEGYVPTSRPWYKKAIECRNFSIVMEPYDDLQMGVKMLSLGKTLCDGQSVIVVDVTVNMIQQMIEETVTATESDMQMIISDSGMVVAHSDKEEVGKNYFEEKDSLVSKIAAQLNNEIKEDYFELDHKNRHYIVYSVKFLNDWHCVSVKDTTKVFAPLNKIFGITIAVGLAIVVIIITIMINYNRRRMAAEKLGTQLLAVSSIYVTMHELDFVNDTFIEIQNHQKELRAFIGKRGGNCHQVIRLIMENFSAPESRKEIVDFVDFAKVQERLKYRNTITLEFLNSEHKWRSARFIVAERLADGRIRRAMYLIEDIDDEKREREKLNAQVEENTNRIWTISKIYVSAYEFNLVDDTFIRIKENIKEAKEHSGDDGTGAQFIVRSFIEKVVDEEFLDDMFKFCDLATLEERLRDTDNIMIEYMFKNKRWIRSRLLVSRRSVTGEITHIILLSQDITKEIKERTRLLKNAERALAASQAKSAFLSNMSHEIRTPINAVLGLNEMILRESNENNILSYAESVRTAGTTLLGLVNDILDFSKIEAGKMEIIPVNYDISSLLNDLVNMIRIKADSKGLKLSLAFDKDTPKLLRGDEIRIKQVITNILTNAVKYTEKGTVTFSVTYEKIAEEPNGVLLNVSIKDTGIGIKPEDIKKLFSEFERIEEERNRNIEGTGLGMNITKRLLEMMGSSLKVSSVYGKGSTFSFVIRQEVIKWEPLGDYETAYKKSLEGRGKYKEKFKAPNAKVLVVDDNQMNLVVFTSLLKHTNVKIDTAMSGDGGLALAGDKKYDIIFFDHMMPKKNGIETLHELKAQKDNPNLKTPTICLTANAISGAREEYLAEGFDDYLTKPIDANKLEDMLIHYLPADKIELSTTGDEVEESVSEVPAELEPLQGLDWIDTAIGLKNSGSLEVYLPLLKIFYTSLEEKAAIIDGFYRAKDYKNYTIDVHGLKSSARIIGAVKFGEDAQLLENAGKREDFDYIQAHHEQFIETFRSFKEPLAQFFADSADDDSSDKPEAEADLMTDVLEKIRAAADDMNCDSLQEIFEEMSKYKIPSDLAELWAKLKEATDKYDYDSILELLTRDDKPVADADLMTDVFAELKAAAEDNDSERLQDILSELSEYRVPTEHAELWTKILSAIDAGDFATILDLLSDKPVADEDLMADVFAELKAAAEDNDSERLQDILAELSEYRVPTEHAELWAKILSTIDAGDFATILDLLSDKPVADEDLMADVFAELKSAAEDNDSERLQDILAEMSEYRIPTEHTELWKKLLSAINAGDFASILDLLSDKPVADEDLMADVFAELKAAAEDNDSERLQDILAEMSEYRIPTEHADLWKKILAAVEASDFATILDLLSDKPVADEDLMADVFAELKAAAEDNDSERLQDILSEMSEYRVPTEHAELWTKISSAIEASDFATILDLLSDKPVADEDLMADVFAELKSAAEDKDSERLQDILAEMSEYRIPTEHADLWAKILSAVDKGDYNLMSNLLTAIKK
ncbi:MAG: response regulator [Selenomonadaceae bacterium]|nr:response regulator [Selenomonadaceae bacterium]